MGCSCDHDGQATCWGRATEGRRGTTSCTPIYRVPLNDCRDVAVGLGFACAVEGDGAVVCWGRNWGPPEGATPPPAGTLFGLPDQAFARIETPVRMRGVRSATAVEAGTLHACALEATGRVVCWGAHASDGVLGGGEIDGAVTVAANTAGGELAVGDAFGCVGASEGITCWGAFPDPMCLETSGSGELAHCGRATTTVSGVTPMVGLSAGRRRFCGVDANRRLVCFGQPFGQLLGYPRVPDLPGTPVLDGVETARLRVDGACAIRGEDVLCWGPLVERLGLASTPVLGPPGVRVAELSGAP